MNKRPYDYKKKDLEARLDALVFIVMITTATLVFVAFG